VKARLAGGADSKSASATTARLAGRIEYYKISDG
jgi:hypothetical protein